jgi:hypothetical protein
VGQTLDDQQQANTGRTAMARPTIEVVDDAFVFHVGRITGELAVNVGAGTFSIAAAAVDLPEQAHADTQPLPHPEHFIDVPIPPPALDFFS